MTSFTKFISMTGFAVLFSASAFAMSPDFSQFDQQDPSQGGGDHDHMGQCIKASWEAANPTDDQNAKAKDACTEIKSVVDKHKDALKADFKALMETFKAYPIVQGDVVKAETALGGEFMPIHDAVRDGAISILNLLTADQRKAFDAAFMECGHHGGHHDGPGHFFLQ
jgi:hypothetical protein